MSLARRSIMKDISGGETSKRNRFVHLSALPKEENFSSS